MGRRKPLLIGQIQFDTQIEAKEFIQEILDRTTWRERLTGDTYEFVLSLLERHPRSADKMAAVSVILRWTVTTMVSAASMSTIPMEPETTSVT
jgi:hypothetical protein